ncbi:MAG: hypothetical protein M1812_003475 [Candelaria pacifica]|nr:MAG: hypothetical protein M1812_003475 [Candelaria pacifica]
MTDIEMPDSGVPPKRGRGRPRKSESEKEKTRVAKLERDKIKRLTKNAQRRSLATQPNHGHPASSQPVPNTGQLSATSHDTHQLRVSVPNNSHSHLERPSCIAAARQNVPEHPKGPAFTSLGGETVPMTSNLSVAQRPLPNRFPAVFDEYNLGLQTFKSNEQEDIFSPISVYPVPNAGNLAAFPVAISPHIILPRQVVTQNTAVDSTLSKRDSPSDPGHQNLGLQTFQQENNFLSVAANRVLNEQDIVTFSAINSPHTVLPGQALTENTAVSRALSNGNLPSGVDTFGLDLQRFQVGEQDNSFLPIAMNPVPNGEDQVAFPAATSVHKVLPQHSQGTPQPASTSSVNPFLPATAPLMQAAPAMRALKYPIQTVEQALSLPGTTNDQEHDQMLATQNRDEKTPEFVFGHGRPRNKKEYRNLSGDMLVKKLYRTEPGLLCDWCSAPGHSDSVGEPRVVADLWERFICNRCATSVLCKIEHANHGNWTPLVLSPHLSSPRCDVCPKGHAVVVCGDCPLRVCTDCQSCLDGTYGTSGDLDQLIDCLQWLGVRDDALVLHSASKDFPRVVTQVPPPTRHLILNRWGDYELVTDADIRADNFLIGVRNPFPSPTPTPEASTGGYDEGELLSHLEF